ncbi:hypothetical protein BB987_20185 [Photorhabdus temperata]|uniref:Tox-ART-HYE1 domain-containing protein n=1 Tax=Photorhabdus khanii NC19 TaxID=1004151 RepID=W3V4F7_9GAMM|nr:hypothetical protein [Photorhabdus khanii]ETS30000.1 hypothetical protein PTE_03330 [Photorhabdus khanii NC19]OHV48322.1 hypothetical protein BB987_20185 [Photorhabdus temperata]
MLSTEKHNKDTKHPRNRERKFSIQPENSTQDDEDIKNNSLGVGLDLDQMIRNTSSTLTNAPQKPEDGYYYHISRGNNLQSFLQNGFKPQGSPGPTLSEEDFSRRKIGIINIIYSIIATTINKNPKAKRISKDNFLMPQEFWHEFKNFYQNIPTQTNIDEQLLRKSITESIDKLDQNKFMEKHSARKQTIINNEREAILQQDERINEIISSRAKMIQQREAENTEGYIYLAPHKNTLLEYMKHLQEEKNLFLILAVKEDIFTEKGLEQDPQEPHGAVRYKGALSTEELNFVNQEGQICAIPASIGEMDYGDFVLNQQQVIDFCKK